jgi:fermentation-respiration switch protein FrsA (DUF1100 family)
VNENPRSFRRAWRIVRLVLIAYLVILLGMMFLERWLVYPAPPADAGDWNPSWLDFEDVNFQSADGTKLHGWFVPHAHPKRAILYCHGNGEHIAFNAELAANLRDTLQASVFLFDYRGYGRSEGRPDEAGCIADALAAQHWLAKRVGLQPNKIVVMGRSLGGAVAVALAAEEGAQALVVENTFPTMPDVAAIHYPWLPVRWIMKNQYDSLSRIKKYHGPLIQGHGARDTFVPMHLARQLFDAAPTTNKEWVEFADCDHNSQCPPDYYDALTSFLDRITAPTAQKSSDP